MIKKVIIVIVTILISVTVYGFDDQDTHPRITGKAINSSHLKDYLVQNLGFSYSYDNEITKTLNSTTIIKSIWKWIADGSKEEDQPTCKAMNHFHNPLLPWGQSYMTDVPWVFTTCSMDGWTEQYSNITWATGYLAPPLSGGQKQSFNYSSWLDPPAPNNWDNARNYYYKALTSNLNIVRETSYAKAFQAIGQLMHLLEDMAVPAHVRNDFKSHLVFTGINSSNLFNYTDWYHNLFELYLINHNKVVDSISEADIEAVKPSLTNIQLTDLWDTGRYRASSGAGNPNPLLTISNAGLAEYTNANFVSDSTIFVTDPNDTHYFPYPRKGDGYTVVVNEPFRGYLNAVQTATVFRPYYKKTGGGDSGYLLAGVGFLDFEMLIQVPTNQNETWTSIKKVPPMDDNVHAAYAAKLIPRAIGYSAELLNYFFRGDINLADPAPDSTPGQFAISNASKEDMSGTFSLFYDDSAGTRTEIKSWPNMQIAAGGTSAPVRFQIPGNGAVEDSKLTIVFQGTMGNEQGAVAGRVVRDRLKVSWPQTYVYSIIDGGASAQQFTRIKANITDNIPSLSIIPSTTIRGGTLQAIARYKIIPNYAPDLSNYPPDGATMTATPYSYSTSALVTVTKVGTGINDPANDVTFDFSGSPIPAGITDLYFYVLFKGVIGNETNATAMGRKDLMEPTHITVWNLSDMSSIDFNNWRISDPSTTTYYNLTPGHHLYSYDTPITSPLSNGKYPVTKLVEVESAATSAINGMTFIQYMDDNHNGTVADELPFYQPANRTYTVSFGNLNSFYAMRPAVTAMVPAGGYIRLIVLVDRPADNYLMIQNDVFTDRYTNVFGGTVNQADQNDVWQAPTPAKKFRKYKPAGQPAVPILQHFYMGWDVSCKPALTDPSGNLHVCPYPDNEAVPVVSPPVDVSNSLNFYK